MRHKLRILLSLALALSLIFCIPALATDITPEQPLSAQWVPNAVKITFNSNGGGVAPGVQVYTYGIERSLPGQCLMVKEGFKFLGWAETADATEPAFAPGETSTTAFGYSDATKAIAKTLYAVWGTEPTVEYEVVEPIQLVAPRNVFHYNPSYNDHEVTSSQITNEVKQIINKYTSKVDSTKKLYLASTTYNNVKYETYHCFASCCRLSFTANEILVASSPHGATSGYYGGQIQGKAFPILYYIFKGSSSSYSADTDIGVNSLGNFTIKKDECMALTESNNSGGFYTLHGNTDSSSVYYNKYYCATFNSTTFLYFSGDTLYLIEFGTNATYSWLRQSDRDSEYLNFGQHKAPYGYWVLKTPTIVKLN